MHNELLLIKYIISSYEEYIIKFYFCMVFFIDFLLIIQGPNLCAYEYI